MAKRKVTFEDPEWGEEEEEEEEEEQPRPQPPRKRAAVAVGGPGSRFSGKPSLDSDEEDEEDEEDEGCGKYNLLAPHDVEGQEAGPAGEGEGEGQVPLTPFNLEEELAEGSFDPHGNYRPRGGAQPPDPWLEAIDWRQIKPRPRQHDVTAASSSSPPKSPSPPPLPLLLRGVLDLLRPGETWEHGGDPKLYGPFSSAQMQEWAAQGYFRGGARCRRVHPQGPFYDCARIDFQLYT
ncbi:CD2 antigen cytoplasmic tail-binding protein 2 [Grus japonensis]|uniref:CD2 antigen cytoplasmic tail-binding protein 2 n=1 Tax=Grus japonensis TaxID=30415 RepID=A0ABC9XYP4_GRUJA